MEQIYTSSSGVKTPVKELETTHLMNALFKTYRETFDCTNQKEYQEMVTKSNMLKEELYRRFNDFSEKLKD